MCLGSISVSHAPSVARKAAVHVQVFDGDIAYLHQAAIIAKSHDASLDNWAKEYYLASAADR